jgi:hypothetical protein
LLDRKRLRPLVDRGWKWLETNRESDGDLRDGLTAHLRANGETFGVPVWILAIFLKVLVSILIDVWLLTGLREDTAPNRERSLAPRGETSREQLDATGWTSAPSPNAPAAASQPVARPSNLSIFVLPSPSRLPSRYDDDWRHDVEGRTQNLEFAVGHVAHTEIPELRRTLDERTATLAYQIDGLEVNRASELPSSPANQKPAPQKPAPQKIIERVEIHKPSTYLELIAQIALVAGGSAATLGSGYGLYLMAARAGLKIARWFHRKHFPPRDAASAPSRPAATTYAWSSTAQAAVPVDSPPVRQSAPPETHYVEVERDWTAKAHQWADEQIARKYADHRLGTVELLIARDALVKQYLASRRS